MIKRHSIGLLFCVLPLAAAAQQTHLDIKVADRIEHDLFGPVDSVKTFSSKETYREGYTKHSQTEYMRTYDSAGNQLTYLKKDITDDTLVQTEFDYDETGCLNSKSVYDSEDDTNTVYTFAIDVDSRQIFRKNLHTGNWRVTAYTPGGREYYIEDRSASNTVTQTIEMKRRPDGKEYEFATRDGDRTLTKTSHFKWNSNGLMREYVYQTHGTNEYIFITRYTHPQKDEHGNWTKRVARTEMIHDGEKRFYSEEHADRKIEYFEPAP